MRLYSNGGVRHMARPSNNLDTRMLAAAVDIVESDGIDGLSIRNICSASGTNTGMFVYHFQNKKNFIIRLCEYFLSEQECNQDLLTELPPLKALRACLDNMLSFCDRSEKIFSSIFFDFVLKHRDILPSVIETVVTKHMFVEVVKRCQDAGYIDKALPAIEIFMMLIGGGFKPASLFFIHKGEDQKMRDIFTMRRVETILKGVLTDKAIKEEIETNE